MPSLPQTNSLKWTLGDFKLISDNVIFKIDSFHLYGASAVFRDARPRNCFAIPQVVEFTDDTIETSPVITGFLSLLTTGTFGDMLDPEKSVWKAETTQLSNLLAFLLEYDCAVWVDVLLDRVLHVMEADQCLSITLFLLGAQANSSKYCVAALRKATTNWPVWIKVGNNRPAHDRSTLDPRLMPFQWFRDIPSEYVWALNAAWDMTPAGERLVAESRKNLDVAKAEKKD